MGVASSIERIRLYAVAAIAAFVLAFSMVGVQAAYADDAQYQADTAKVLTIQKGRPYSGGGGSATQPTTPTDPENPADPANPENPTDQPATPDQPSSPTQPSTPGDQPGSSTQPGATDQPSTVEQTAPANGDEVTAGTGASEAEYTVTNASAATVAYSAPATKAKTVKVPAKVTINGKSYKVTSIASNAFKGNKTATSVVVGKNITKIGKQAFKGSKVKTLNVNSKKLTKKGVKNSLKGSKIKTVKVPKAKVKAYKKIFTKANCGKKVTVKAK